MKDRTRLLGCEGLGPKEITLIKSMLRLFDGKTHGRWQFTETAPFDALLVPDGRSGLSEQSETEHEALFIRTMLPTSDTATPPSDDADTELEASEFPTEKRRNPNPTFLIRPIRALTLLQKLNEVGEYLDQHETQQLLKEQGWEALREWQDMLIEWRNSQENYMVETTICKFVIFPRAGRFICEKPQLTPKQLIGGRIRTYKILDAQRAAQILRVKRTSRLSWLCWHAVHHASAVQSIPGLDLTQHFRLRRWPDFGSLDHDPVYVPMAGMLSQRVLSIGEMEKMGFANTPLQRFLNACYLAGYLELVAPNQSGWWFGKRSENAGERLGLFAKIRHKLGI